jgi:CRP-like cAMP-binding protein
LHDHRFLAGLPAAQFAALVPLASEASFAENELVLVDGQHSASFYLVVSGSVSIELRTALYAISVQALGAGAAFGWSALLDDQDTLFQVRARENTVALRFDGAALKSKFREDPVLGTEILPRLLRLAAERIRATEIRFAEMCGVRV